MLTPDVGAPMLAAIFLLLLWGIGLGPATYLLGWDLGLALAPALGLALCIGLLTTVDAFGPLDISGPVALTVGLAASLATVFFSAARGKFGRSPLFMLGGLGCFGIAVALVPCFAHRTYGPVDLYFMDSWFYRTVDHFLSTHGPEAAAMATASHRPLDSLLTQIQSAHFRLGIDTLQTAFLSLMRTNTTSGQMPLQAGLVGIVATTLFGLARWVLGLRCRWAMFAAVMAVLSPVTAQLWVDARPANLVAVSLAPAALVLLARAATDRRRRKDAIAAGVLMSGFVVAYTEHGATLILACAFTAATLLALQDDRRQTAKNIVQSALIAGLVAFVVSPVGAVRAFHYAWALSNQPAGGPVIDGLRARTLPPLAFGTTHLYELYKLPLLHMWRVGVVYGVIAFLIVIVIAGIGNDRRRTELGPVVAVSALFVSGLLVSMRFEVLPGGCGSYCVSKGITLSGPALALAVALGLSRAMTFTSRRRLVLAFAAFGTIGWVFLAGRGTLELERAAARLPFAMHDRDLAISGAVKALPGTEPVLIEGAEQRGDVGGFFDAHEILALAGYTQHPVVYDKALLGYIEAVDGSSWRPDYRFVLSRYPALRHPGSRTILRRFGEYVLESRPRFAPDAVMVGAGQWRDSRDSGSAAIPWMRGPLAIRIVDMIHGGALRIALTGPLAATTTMSVPEMSVHQRKDLERRFVCVDVPPGSQTRDLQLIPDGLLIPLPVRRPSDPVQRTPHSLGITSMELTARRC